MKIENNNLSEEAIALQNLTESIKELEDNIEFSYNQIRIKESNLERLKERKKSLLNYLNTDNN